jgi:cysteine rich repeat protein
VLDQDLEIHAINGVARIVQDSLDGTYNACFEADGEKNCTYQPWAGFRRACERGKPGPNRRSLLSWSAAAQGNEQTRYELRNSPMATAEGSKLEEEIWAVCEYHTPVSSASHRTGSGGRLDRFSRAGTRAARLGFRRMHPSSRHHITNALRRHIMIYRATVLLLLTATVIPAVAQQPTKEQELQMIRANCGPDIQRLCQGVEPGGGRLKECLMQHKEQMSVGCAQTLQKLKAQQGQH